MIRLPVTSYWLPVLEVPVVKTGLPNLNIVY